MKIIISSSKTMNKGDIRQLDIDDKGLINSQKTKYLIKKIKEYDKDSLAKKMHIKNKLADETYELYQKYEESDSYQAVNLYSGTVFKQFEINEEGAEYLEKHLIILSALYGILNPFTLIRRYRLDMTMNMFETNLYKYWQNDVDEYFKDEIIINLASDEYSKMIKKDKVNIIFYQMVNGKMKKVAYHCKVARGLMLDYIIKYKIEEIEVIKSFNAEGYKYNNELSDKGNLVFIKD